MKHKKNERKHPLKAIKEWIKGIDISLRAFITVMIILVSTFMVHTYMFISSDLTYKRYEKELISQLEFQSRMISSEIIENEFVIDGNDKLNVLIESAAGFVNGRILVVDRNYLILKDTFKMNQGSYVINEDLIEAMNSGLISQSDEGEYIQYICPIKIVNEVKGAIIFDISKEQLNSLSSKLARKDIITFVIIAIFSVIVAIIIGNASVRGINYINKQMEVYSDGHLDAGIEEKGFKEFRTMTRKYNKTINRLMVIDSTRQEFVSNVSHELKTPITSMKVLADSLIENEQADLDMYKEFMTDIVDEIDRETKIINDLLTLVRLDKKSAKLNIEELDINNLLEVIIKRVTPIAQTRGIEITYESYRDVVAEVDEVKLSLALTNIIENAVKYNVDNGWIKVTLNADHKNFYVKVADSGVGIPDDCKDLVFDRFYRVDKARSRDTGGTGLGLAITKNAIVMHGGSVKLYSESGEGTTFTIRVPLRRSAEKE